MRLPLALRYERALPLGAMAVIVAEGVAVPFMVLQGGYHSVLSVALILDVLLCVGTCLWLLRGQVELDAHRVSRAAVLGVVLASLGSRLAAIELPAGFMGLAAAIEIALVGWVMHTLWRERGAGGGEAAERLRARLGALLPEAVVDVLLAEVRLLGGAVAALLRRPVVAPADGFGFVAKSRSGFLVPVLLLVAAVELPATHYLLYVLLPGQLWPHTVSAGMALYTAIWVIGDRRALASSAHRLADDGLRLDLGLRFQAHVRYAQLEHVERLRDAADRRRVQLLPERPNTLVSPYDPPNVHLRLSHDVTARLLFGLRRRVRALDLYVDDPEGFVRELELRLRAFRRG
jgi:hypothetical protein